MLLIGAAMNANVSRVEVWSNEFEERAGRKDHSDTGAACLHQ
jgi:hypothetical protein